MMIDEYTQRMIDIYIPNPPDPTLQFDEYYYLQNTRGGNRVIRVFVMTVWPTNDGNEYAIYQQHGMQRNRIDVSGEPDSGVHKSALYDNRQDCIDQTHMMYDDWERLRKIQRQEGSDA